MTSAAHPGCDAAVATAVADHSGPAHPRLVLITTILASSLAMVDGSVVNVGLPAIGRTLHAASSDLQWVVNAYLLPLSALLLLGGGLGDRFGRRLLLIIGVALFAVSSAACALAPSIGWLLLARAVQGVASALLMPNSLAILGAAFTGRARGQAIGAWAATGSMTAALGPVLGGWLIDHVGWPSIFLINIPLAAGAIWLALAYVERERPAEKPAPLDLAGAVVATVALGALAWGLTVGSGRQGWTTAAATGAIGGVALLAAFVWIEKRRGERAMMPLALFASRSFIGLSLLTLLLYGVLGGLLVLLPYVLIRAVGYSATAAGAALLPFPLIIAIASPFMGGVAGRFGARLPLGLGPIIVGAGLLLTLRIGEPGGYVATVLPAILVISIGMAAAVAPLTTAVLSSVDARHTGSASGFNSALARTGGLVATALLGAALAGQGLALIADFRKAAIAGALAAAAAGACAFIFVDGKPAAGAKDAR
jgi:EmrB/QacA subfamily drug resistance transporter